MSISHRTNRLKLINQPAVEQLQNGRYRLTLRCRPLNPRNDWFNTNKANIFLTYGSLYSDTGSPVVDGLANRSGEAYDNMRLVTTESIGRGDDYVIELVYETLGDTFVQVKDDTIDYELNGLRRVTRESIAKAGVDFQKTVGTTTITSQIDGESAVTLYLAAYEVDDTDSFRRVEEVYIEAGEIGRDVRSIGDGVQATTFQTFITDPSTVSGQYVLRRDIDNFLGFQRITTVVISKKDGTPLTDATGGEKLAFEYEKLVPFTFPGVVDLVREQNHIFPSVRSPVEAIVKADVYTYYQTSNDIVSGDFTKEGSLGLWNPSDWCQKISTIDAYLENGRIQPAYYNAQGIRGCRTRTSVAVTNHLVTLDDYRSQADSLSVSGGGVTGASGTSKPPQLNLEESIDVLNGKSIYRQTFKFTYDVVSGITHIGSGVLSFDGPFTVSGEAVCEARYNSSNKWELVVTKTIRDPIPTDSTSPTWPAAGSSVYKRSRLGGDVYVATYTNANSGPTETIYAVSTETGQSSPVGLTYVTTGGSTITPAISVGASSNEESYSIQSAGSGTLTSVNIPTSVCYIEGRMVGINATGKISISGGPPNPTGRKYTLDVNIKKAFTDKNGTDIFQKQIVIATCTAV